MSDDIIVSGGGSVVVASDAILTRIEKISRLAEEFRTERAELIALQAEHRVIANLPAPGRTSMAEASRRVDDAASLLASTSGHAEDLYRSLRACLTVYGEGEKFIEQVGRNISAQFAWALGRVAPVVVVPIAAGLLVEDGIFMAVTHVTLAEEAQAAGRLLEEHNAAVSSPVTVALLRATVMDLDEFGEGLIGAPQAAALARDAGGGVNRGMPGTAAAIVAIANQFGLLEESGVSVRRTSTSTGVAAPTSLTDRMSRIPDPAAGGGDSRIRIDRYSTPGQPDSFDVYIAGTADFGLKSAGEPFDMTSNVVGVAQESPASYRAVVDAMRQAGVTPTSPVVVTGYSQGGLVASLVAASGDYDVKGLVTFGAPSGQIAIPADVPMLTVRHSEDIVPATGGYDVNPQALVVERSLFDGGPPPAGDAVPAHERANYLQTAGLVDRAESTEVRSRLDALDGFAAGAASVQSTLWTATRVPEAATFAVPSGAGG